MRVSLHPEGEVVQQGVSFATTDHFYYVVIRRGDNFLEVKIPKENPKNYSVEEFTKNKWDQRLWL